MKKILISLLMLGSISAFANTPVVRCDLDYVNRDGSGMHLRIFYDVGKMSIQNCIEMAFSEIDQSKNGIEMRFFHYTRSCSENLDFCSEGWIVSAKILEKDTKPVLSYEEFINP